MHKAAKSVRYIIYDKSCFMVVQALVCESKSPCVGPAFARRHFMSPFLSSASIQS